MQKHWWINTGIGVIVAGLFGYLAWGQSQFSNQIALMSDQAGKLDSISGRLDSQVSRIDAAFSEIGTMKENVAITRGLAENTDKFLGAFGARTDAQIADMSKGIDKRFDGVEEKLNEIRATLATLGPRKPIMFDVKDPAEFWGIFEKIYLSGPIYIGSTDMSVQKQIEAIKAKQQ